MREAIAARIEDVIAAAERLSGLLADGRAGQLPGLLVARLGVDADRIASRLDRHLQALERHARGGKGR